MTYVLMQKKEKNLISRTLQLVSNLHFYKGFSEFHCQFAESTELCI